MLFGHLVLGTLTAQYFVMRYFQVLSKNINKYDIYSISYISILSIERITKNLYRLYDYIDYMMIKEFA